MYTRGRKRVRQEDAYNESIATKLDGCHTSLASSTFLVDSDRTEQENLELLDDQGDQSRSGQDATWTQGVCNGENRHNGPDVPPCVESMKGQKSSDKEVRALISKPQELQTPGLCNGQSNCNETDTPHCPDSEKEDSRRTTSSDHYVHREEYEGAKSNIIAEHLACFPRKQQLIAVRKVPESIAKKMYAFSSTDNHQEHSLKCNNDGAQKMSEKEGVQKLNKQNSSEVKVRSSPRFANKLLPVGQKAVMKQIEHNLEVPGDNQQEHSLRCNNDGAQKIPEKEGVQKLNKQNNSEVKVRSSPRFANKLLPVGQKAVMKKIEHNLEVPGDNHQEHSLKCNNDGAQKMSEKEGVQKLNKQNNSEVEVRSSPRFTNKWVPVGEKAVMRKIEHNLELPGAGTVPPKRFAHEGEGKEAAKRTKKKMKTKKLNGLCPSAG
ncbi:hypothetical protein U9M48_040681 [Paspalum notatum var. saurae]|uniref:Uncharacterized protein n=1 Tax=Paspalum notatum var. saurae TaxID=547442 RepID=A0AAQ3XDH2_PASNO